MDIFQSAGYAAKKTSPAKYAPNGSNLFPFALNIMWTDKRIRGVHQTGSRYICNPPVLDTDEDYIVLIGDDDGVKFIEQEGFVASINDAYSHMKKDGFVSFRSGQVNLIVTSNKHFFDNFVKATELAKEFNLTDKKHRIMLFQALRAGKPKVASP